MKKMITKIAVLFAVLSLILATMVQAQDNPPTPFLADFNAQTGDNNYGGTVGAFYGGGDPFFQDDGQVTNAYTEVGESGLGGDYAWSITNAALPQGANYTFFGAYVQLRAAVTTPTDISGFETLSFDIKIGSGTAFDACVVRLEDTDGTEEYNNKSIVLSTLTTSYAHYDIPLADFVSGGGQVVDLTKVKTIAWVQDAPGGAGTVEMNLVIDNVEITGTGGPIPTPTPVETPAGCQFVADYEDGGIVNSEGGLTGFNAGWGDPFTETTDQLTSSIVDLTSTKAYQLQGSFTHTGTYSYIAWFTRMDVTPDAPKDITCSSQIEVIGKVLGNDNLTWNLRLEDTTDMGNPQTLDKVVLPLTTANATYTFPLTDFTDGDNGRAVNLDAVRTITIVAENGASSPLDCGLVIDSIKLITPLAADADWALYE